MASDNKKAKPEAAPKKDAAAKVESPAAADAPKDALKKESAKPEGGETVAAVPSNYSRGEGQKPVTAAYKEHWNAIFGKGKKKKR
ncbi:MAG: hypothetical protein WBE64_14470 [Xanthobacteraceae bacterium]